jgi:hypothetical protein
MAGLNIIGIRNKGHTRAPHCLASLHLTEAPGATSGTAEHSIRQSFYPGLGGTPQLHYVNC